MFPCPDLTPEELVARVQELPPGSPGHEQAVVQLAQYVQCVAEQVARRLHTLGQVSQDLVDQSWEHVEPRLGSFNTENGTFTPWLRTVLHNLGRDLCRRSRRGVSFDEEQLDEYPERQANGNPIEDNLEKLTQLFGQMRTALDQLTPCWPPSRAVDYCAVFLVCLRVQLAERYRALIRQYYDEIPLNQLADCVARWLPWHPHEEPRSFRCGLPSIGDLWEQLAPLLNENRGLNVVLTALGEQAVSYTTFTQWVHRARQQAQERLGDDWQLLGFANLLTPHRNQED